MNVVFKPFSDFIALFPFEIVRNIFGKCFYMVTTDGVQEKYRKISENCCHYLYVLNRLERLSLFDISIHSSQFTQYTLHTSMKNVCSNLWIDHMIAICIPAHCEGWQCHLFLNSQTTFPSFANWFRFCNFISQLLKTEQMQKKLMCIPERNQSQSRAIYFPLSDWHSRYELCLFWQTFLFFRATNILCALASDYTIYWFSTW